MAKYAQVIIDAVLGNNQAWDYAIPSTLTVTAGACVTVPFGKQQIDGYVLAVSDQTAVAENLIKPITAVKDSITIKPELLALLPQICAKFKLRYLDVLKLFVPSAVRGEA